jgi:hypothetical protein
MSPTVVPTAQVYDTISFESALSLSGLSSGTLSSSDEAAIIDGVVKASDSDSITVSIVSVVSTELPSRRVLLSGGHITTLVTYSLNVTVGVTANLVDFATTDSSTVYNSLVSSIQTASGSGNLTTYIQQAAVVHGAAVVATAVVSVSTVSVLTVIVPPTMSPTSQPLAASKSMLSLGVIVGVAIGVFVVLIVSGFALKYYFCASGTVHVSTSVKILPEPVDPYLNEMNGVMQRKDAMNF